MDFIKFASHLNSIQSLILIYIEYNSAWQALWYIFKIVKAPIVLNG